MLGLAHSTGPARVVLRAGLIALLSLAGGAVQAQGTPDAAPARLRVFLDCRTGDCDRNFFITELPFVAWTQDRLDAEVHALITELETASGGSEYTVALLGQRRFDGRGDTLAASIPPNSTDDAERREIARLLRIGLAPFAVRVGAGASLDVRASRTDSDAAPPTAAALNDPWNLWVYRVGLEGDGEAESRAREYTIEVSTSARRITEQLKIEAAFEYQHEGNAFTLSSGEKRYFALREVDGGVRIVKSVSDHWSLGAGAGAGLDEFSNQDLFVGLDAAIEYNFYPWREATRRQLLLIGTVGARHFDYAEQTIFLRLSETRPLAQVILAGETRQAWGSLDASLRHVQYLHDARRYSLSFDGSASIRLTRGLALSFSAFGEKVNDQLYIERGDATDDEVLTRQRALATAYRFGGSVGISFTFGSIFNTIVNPRFDRVD